MVRWYFSVPAPEVLYCSIYCLCCVFCLNGTVHVGHCRLISSHLCYHRLRRRTVTVSGTAETAPMASAIALHRMLLCCSAPCATRGHSVYPCSSLTERLAPPAYDRMIECRTYLYLHGMNMTMTMTNTTPGQASPRVDSTCVTGCYSANHLALGLFNILKLIQYLIFFYCCSGDIFPVAPPLLFCF